MRKIVFLCVFLTSCFSKNAEFELSFYNDISYEIWNEKPSFKEYCYKKPENQIRIVKSLITDLIENKYNRGKDVVFFSKECDVDMLVLTYKDLLELTIREINQYSEIFPLTLANAYSKYNHQIKLRKFLEYNYLSKKILIVPVIANIENQFKPFYLSEYRIEKPQYEINKIISQKRFNYFIIILETEKRIHYNRETIGIIKDFIKGLDKRPDVIFTNIDKNLNIDGTRVIGYPYQMSSFSFDKRYGFFEKIEGYHAKKLKDHKETILTDEIVRKTNAFFSRKITTSLSDIKIDDRRASLAFFVSYVMYRFLKSDMAIVSSKILVKGIKKGDVRVEDIYSILSKPDERLVYLKIRGENLNLLINNLLNPDLAITYKARAVKKENLSELDFKPQKLYRVLTTESSIKDNTQILDYVSEFSVLGVKLVDGIMWYARNHKLGSLN